MVVSDIRTSSLARREFRLQSYRVYTISTTNPTEVSTIAKKISTSPVRKLNGGKTALLGKGASAGLLKF